MARNEKDEAEREWVRKATERQPLLGRLAKIPKKGLPLPQEHRDCLIFDAMMAESWLTVDSAAGTYVVSARGHKALGRK
jgi:hypothetical protein